MNAIVLPPIKGNVHYPPLSISSLKAFLKMNEINITTFDFNKQLYLEDPNMANSLRYYFYPSMLSDESEKIWNIDTIYNIELLLYILFKDKNIKPKDKDTLEFIANLEKECQVKAEYLVDSGFTVIGISSYVSNVAYSCLLAKFLKEIDPNIKIIFGGPSTAFPPNRDFLLKTNLADFIVVGEGEYALRKIINDINNRNNINYNVIFSANTNVDNLKETEIKVDSIKEIDELPFPNFDDFDLSLYSPPNKEYLILPITSSTGCINKCYYCSETQYWRKFKKKSVERVINEIRYGIEKYNAKAFHFCDSLINGDVNWLEKFCQKIIDHNLFFQWTSFASVHNLEKKLIIKMQRAGCVRLTLGIEHVSNRILKDMNKRTSLWKAEEVLNDCINYGILPVANFIYGLPGEKDEDFTEMLYFISKPNFISNVFFTFRPFEIRYGSSIAKDLIKSNKDIKRRNYDIAAFSFKLKEIIRNIDIYWNPGITYFKELYKKFSILRTYNIAQETYKSIQKSTIKRHDIEPILSRIINKKSIPEIISDGNNNYEFYYNRFNNIQLEFIKRINGEKSIENISEEIFNQINQKHNLEYKYDSEDMKHVIEGEILLNSIFLTQKNIIKWLKL